MTYSKADFDWYYWGQKIIKFINPLNIKIHCGITLTILNTVSVSFGYDLINILVQSVE